MGRRGYLPSPRTGGYERMRRSPSPPRSYYGGGGSRGRPVERGLPTSLLVCNLRLDCRFVLAKFSFDKSIYLFFF